MLHIYRVQEKVAQAVEIAERHFDTFRVESLTRNERNQVLAALGFKLPLAYVFIYASNCVCALSGPVFGDMSACPATLHLNTTITVFAETLPRC